MFDGINKQGCEIHPLNVIITIDGSLIDSDDEIRFIFYLSLLRYTYNRYYFFSRYFICGNVAFSFRDHTFNMYFSFYRVATCLGFE